jgi:hypothetical protein
MPPIWWSDSKNGWIIRHQRGECYDVVQLNDRDCVNVAEELTEIPDDAVYLHDPREPRRIAFAGGNIRIRGEATRTGDRCDDLDCLVCGSRHVAVYKCSACDHKWEIPGEYQYFWQGHGHFHKEDEEGWSTDLINHVTAHDPPAVAFPEYDDSDPLWRATRTALTILRDAGFDQPELTERLVRILAADLGVSKPVVGEPHSG